ncbi:MAG: ATP-binding cassette domain-containing protein [Candidatus Sumerlaeia bacterium]
MACILNNATLSFGARPILRGVNLNINDGECVAVVGPNGCGKSTLLRVIAGTEHLDSGEIKLPKGCTVGYLPQEANLHVEHSLEAELLDAFSDLREIMDEMTVLEKKMGEVDPQAPEYERILKRYSDCSHEVEHRNAYAMEAEVRKVAAGLGFSLEDLERSCREYSGGWQMRILLAKLLLRRPDVMLLDEPTNHLDLETTLWLENWIRACDQTVIFVSHERATMDRLAQRIVCMEQGTADVYPGDYSHYLQQSALKREAQWEAYEQQQKEIESMENFIRRFRATASRASLVQSRIKQLEKIERLEPPFHPTAIHFDFPPAPQSYSDVVIMEELSHSYDGVTRVFDDINFTIQKGEKVGLVGVNGAGKSTLLKIMARRMKPTSGSCTLGGKVQMAYFAQYDTETLDSELSLLDAIQREAPIGQAQRGRDLLGAFLFRGDDVEKPLSVLSGGERTRFRLARLLFSTANLLLLDEPTNHLDVSSRATVEEALRDYEGTLVIVSHDRIFMEKVTNKILELDGGKLRMFPGNYGDYLRYKEQQLKESPEDESAALRDAPQKDRARRGKDDASMSNKEARIQEREERKAQDRKRKKIERRIAELESKIEKGESAVAELEEEMARPEIAADFPELSKLTEERNALVGKNANYMEEWESLHETLN